jgi:hypothetical protein
MSENKNQKPLSVMMENAKAMMIASFNQVQAETALPAYLMEGIVLDLLAQVRNQKNLELVSDYNKMQVQEEKKGEKIDG